MSDTKYCKYNLVVSPTHYQLNNQRIITINRLLFDHGVIIPCGVVGVVGDDDNMIICRSVSPWRRDSHIYEKIDKFADSLPYLSVVLVESDEDGHSKVTGWQDGKVVLEIESKSNADSILEMRKLLDIARLNRGNNGVS